jgi:acetone carboxylase gamma subunit
MGHMRLTFEQKQLIKKLDKQLIELSKNQKENKRIINDTLKQINNLYSFCDHQYKHFNHTGELICAYCGHVHE